MTNSPFTIHVKTPSGEAKISADTWERLIKLMPASIKQAMPGGVQDEAFEAHVKALYEAYKKRFKISPRSRSPIETHCVDIDLVRCFLRRMTIKQAAEWLKTNKSVESSLSAIGRYWKRFLSLGFNRNAFTLP